MPASRTAPVTAPISATDREVIYVADPCCSWCWGFSPIINDLREEFKNDLQFTLKLGGLRVGPHHVRDAARKAYLHETWSRVAALSGQPFDLAALARDGVSEDTEPSCRAAIVMRTRAPDRAFSFMRRLQHAFFAAGLDISRDDVLADLAAAEGEDPADFFAALTSAAARQAAHDEFAAVKAMGVHGFPTTVVRHGASYKLLAAGFRPRPAMRQFFDYWLRQD